jgi:hypothetical protein
MLVQVACQPFQLLPGERSGNRRLAWSRRGLLFGNRALLRFRLLRKWRGDGKIGENHIRHE